MRWAEGRSVCRPGVCRMLLALGLLCGSCSPRNGEQKEDPAPTPAVSQQQPQPKPSGSEDLEGLRQENADLKKAMADVLPYLDEIKKLRSENEQLKKAAAETLAMKDQMEKLRKKIETLKLAAASATTANELLASALTDTVPSDPAQAASYRQYKDRHQKRTAELLVKYGAASNVQERVEFIQSLTDAASRQDPAVLGVVRKALSDPDPKVARAAVELLADYEIPETLPAIEQALKLPDEQIRAAAVGPLNAINDPQVIQLLSQALNDPSAQVRAAALEALQEQDNDPIQLSIMEQAITNPYKDVKYEVASMLGERSDHAAVELLMAGLRDQDPKFRETITENLDFMIDQQFETYEEAQAWWTANKGNYDAELIQIDEPAKSSGSNAAEKSK